MKPLFWKELRQNLKWTVGVLVVMSLAAVYTAWLVSHPEWAGALVSWSQYITPSERFQQLSGLGCPVAGLFLGVLHVVLEKRRDLWAFLVHRPIPRTTVFLAKASAGLLLYLVAVGIPVAGGTVWLATPGHAAAPFYWPMVLPGLTDVLTGTVYYLAGLLISMREARWYGSRVLALGVAVLCSLVVVSVPHLWIALIAIVVAASILGVAAWGSFLGGGQYQRQPLSAKAALGVSLLTGITVVFVVGATILLATAGFTRYASTSYQLTLDGEVVRLVQGRWGRVVEITNLDGTPNERLEREARELDYVFSLFLRPVDVVVHDEAPPPGYRSARRFYRGVGADGPTQWLYSFPERLVLAFDRERKVLVGRLGPDGFDAAPDPPRRRFGPDIVLASWSSLTFADIVYRLNIHKRTVEEFLAPTGERVLAFADLRGWRLDSAFIVVTDQTVRFFSLEGDILLAADVEHDLGLYRHLGFTATDEPPRSYVWYRPYGLSAEALEIPSHVIAYGPDGAAVARHELPPIPRPSGTATWREAVTGLVVPLALMVAASVVTLVQGKPLFGPEGLAAAYVLLVLIPLVAVACAVVTVRLARRYAFSRGQRWGWGVFNFLVGPVGLSLLWALREWPARLLCPACGNKRVANRERCEHCGESFPSPAHDGTEIFEEGLT